MLPIPKKTILTALFIETILVLSGVSKVIKNKSPKSDHITVFLTGHNSDSSEHSIQEVSEEAFKYLLETAAIVTV